MICQAKDDLSSCRLDNFAFLFSGLRRQPTIQYGILPLTAGKQHERYIVFLALQR